MTDSPNQVDALLDRPAVELRDLIAARELSPVALLEATLDRVQRLNPALNAYCLLLEEQARAAAQEAERAVARGGELPPLHGLPVSIKDGSAIAGVRTTLGSKAFLDNVPAENSAVVDRFIRAGAILVGKTPMHEFGNSCMGDGLLFGEVHNPWNPSRISGGSSGGASAGVASGLAALADGSDGMGSIRVPASCCGVVGLKPSIGRVPIHPLNGFETLGQHGPIARTVLDCALALDALAGYDARDVYALEDPTDKYVDTVRSADVTGWRVAYSPTLGINEVEPEVRRVVDDAVHRFVEAEGLELLEIESPMSDPRAAEKVVWSTMVGYYGDKYARPVLEPAEIDPHVLELMDRASSYSAWDYYSAGLEFRNQLRSEMLELFGKVDLLITPTIGVVPFAPLGGAPGPDTINGVPVEPFSGWVFTYPFNLTGQPAISVPAGLSDDGLPIGLQIVGAPRSDAAVLQAGHRFEVCSAFAGATPPLDGLASIDR